MKPSTFDKHVTTNFMNITFNSIEYDVNRIALIHTEGNVIKVELDKLIDLESAPVPTKEVPGHSDYLCVSVVGDKYKVLVRSGSEVTAKTKIYLLSKFVLKKCQANAVYDDSLQREQRMNMYSDRQDRQPSRYGDSSRNFRGGDYGRPRSRGY